MALAKATVAVARGGGDGGGGDADGGGGMDDGGGGLSFDGNGEDGHVAELDRLLIP